MINRKGIICRIRRKANEYCRVLPRRIAGTDIELRFIRLKDLSRVRPFLPVTSATAGTSSLFSLWKTLFDTYQAFYLIWDKNKPSEPIGFIGLYRMIPCISSYVSIEIFNKSNRMQGYGSKAMLLLLDYSRERALAENIYAESLESNEAARSFLERLGFEVFEKKGERLVFKKCLLQSGGSSER